jgi:hypothetical protein
MFFTRVKNRRLLLVLSLSILVFWGTNLTAAPLDLGESGVTGSLDTTVSFGMGIRTSGRDSQHIARITGGEANSANSDDGNLNYDQWDIFSLNNRITQELDLRRQNMGLFIRGTYLYDWAIMNMETERTPLSREARDRAGFELRLMDAFLTADFELVDRPLNIRVGQMVINWGESTFIQNGINTVNPVDVSKLRVAGSELREAFVPVPAVHAAYTLNNRFSLEGFYQLGWKATEIEPAGTFFSTSDIAGPGADYVMLGFGGATDVDPATGTFIRRRLNDPTDPTQGYSDATPQSRGQFGVALRYFEPHLNDTEFGFYYTRLHSRLPIISAETGVLLNPADVIGDGDNPAIVVPGTLIATSTYFREYPKSIHTLGSSFNTQLNFLDIALQGEATYRQRQPLQVDDVELLYGALSALDPVLGTSFGISQAVDTPPGANEEVSGFKRKDVIQGQLTTTKLFGPRLGLDNLVFVGEVGGTYVLDMEKKSELRYEAAGTNTSGNAAFTDAAFGTSAQPATQRSGFPDPFSMGYRILVNGQINNALGPVNLIPGLAFNHDVVGTTPAPLANFVENRMALTTSVGATYLNNYRADLSYTNFFGAAEFNLLNDRDFLAFSMSASF